MSAADTYRVFKTPQRNHILFFTWIPPLSLPPQKKENVFMSMNIYIGNLSYDVSETELNELFKAYGVVESAKIITDRYSGNSKGFAFVEMADRSQGEQAINELNGKQVRDREIKVSEARPKKNNRGGGRGGGGYGDRRGGGARRGGGGGRSGGYSGGGGHRRSY